MSESFQASNIYINKQLDHDERISAIRLIAMFLIIACHMFQAFNSEIASWLNVGVQIFLVISGYLYGKKEIDSSSGFIKRQFKKILIPYYCFLISVSLLYILFARDYFSFLAFVKSLFGVGTLDGIKHLWFIGYILLCYFLTPIFNSFLGNIKDFAGRRFQVFLSIAIIFLIGIAFGILSDSFFNPVIILPYFIGYTISYFENI